MITGAICAVRCGKKGGTIQEKKKEEGERGMEWRAHRRDGPRASAKADKVENERKKKSKANATSDGTNTHRVSERGEEEKSCAPRGNAAATRRRRRTGTDTHTHADTARRILLFQGRYFCMKAAQNNMKRHKKKREKRKSKGEVWLDSAARAYSRSDGEMEWRVERGEERSEKEEGRGTHTHTQQER